MATTRTSIRPEVAVKATTTATTTTEVKLAPALRKKLLTYLGSYQTGTAMARQAKALKADASNAIRKLRESTGASSLELDGWRITDTGGETLDRDATNKKLMAIHGLTIEDIKACEVYKPKKRYDKITLPGEGDSDE